MEQITLPVKKKEECGKKAAKAMRREGFIPGVVYGQGIDNIHVAVNVSDTKPLKRRRYSENMVINLQVEDQKKTIPTILHDYQVHPISCNIIHMDFLKINLKEKIHVHIPVKLKGQAEGEKLGGVVDQHLFDMSVSCLPTDMVEFIVVDISELGLGSIHAEDLTMPNGIEMLEETSAVIVSCGIKAVVEEAEEGAEEAGAEGAPAAEGSADAKGSDEKSAEDKPAA